MSIESKSFGQSIKGMLYKLKLIQAISSNITNANSIGYQRKIPESIDFQSILDETALRDITQGHLQKTNRSLDLGIEGNAYFLIETKSGIESSRNGRFYLNSEGELVTQEGNKVIIVEKTEEDISLAKDFDISVNQKGEIFVGDNRYGRIAMQIQDSKPVHVHQGFIEGSNVNLTNEMVALAMTFRSFEASEKALSMEASIDRELIDKYGRNV